MQVVLVKQPSPVKKRPAVSRLQSVGDVEMVILLLRQQACCPESRPQCGHAVEAHALQRVYLASTSASSHRRISSSFFLPATSSNGTPVISP